MDATRTTASSSSSLSYNQLIVHLYRSFLAHLLYLRNLISVPLNNLGRKSDITTATIHSSTQRKINRNQLLTLQFIDGIDEVIHSLSVIVELYKLSNEKFSIFTIFGPSIANPKESYCLHFRECCSYDCTKVMDFAKLKVRLERNMVRNLIEHPINTIIPQASKSSWNIFTIVCTYNNKVPFSIEDKSPVEEEDGSMEFSDQSLLLDENASFSFRDASAFKPKHKPHFGCNPLPSISDESSRKKPRKISGVLRRRLLFPVEMAVDLQQAAVTSLLPSVLSERDSAEEEEGEQVDPGNSGASLHHAEKASNWWDGASEWEVGGWWVQRRGVRALRLQAIPT